MLGARRAASCFLFHIPSPSSAPDDKIEFPAPDPVVLHIFARGARYFCALSADVPVILCVVRRPTSVTDLRTVAEVSDVSRDSLAEFHSLAI